MKKINLSEITKNMKNAVSKHTPEILTGFGIAGMFTTTILAVKATPKAIKLIEAEKKESNKEKLTVIETVKTTWKCYIPAGTIALVSTGCLIGASSVNLRRNAVLATAYKIAENTHKEYREKVIETIGEKKEKVINDNIMKDKMDKNPVDHSTVIITDKGNTLCYDALSGRYFKSDIDKIKKVENELNRRMRNDNYISLNEFYDEIGLEHINPLGDDLGWNIDRGYIDIQFSPQLTPNDEPCVAINFSIAPRYDFYRC